MTLTFVSNINLNKLKIKRGMCGWEERKKEEEKKEKEKGRMKEFLLSFS